MCRKTGGVTEPSGTESGALDPQNAILDTELAAIVDVWPVLPEAIRAGILAMIRAAQPTFWTWTLFVAVLSLSIAQCPPPEDRAALAPV
jgi:hypothetical protein